MSFELKFDDKKFNRAINDALKKVDDLTKPLTDIKDHWYETNKAIFAQRGPGGYPDLSPIYKILKRKEVGFIYPILRKSGALERSITNSSNGSALWKILNKRSLVLGSNDKKVPFHQFGTKNMPARPPIMIGTESFAPSALRKRRDVWIKILGDYVYDVSKDIGE